jgi:hypothetical protein
MARKLIPIDIMNAQALATIVVANMGLDVNPKMGLLGIKAKLAQAGFPTDFIEFDDGEEDAPIEPASRHGNGTSLASAASSCASSRRKNPAATRRCSSTSTARRC